MERAEAEAIYEQGREAVVAVLMRMDEQIARLSERVAGQDERIGELERRLNRNSRDSSAPPSQDPPGERRREREQPSPRQQGAQPGHRGHGRRLLPPDVVDEIIEHWPERCGCGHVFRDAEREPVASRHTISSRSCPRSR